MTIYWPNKQSINLNLAVAKLFVQTYQKFSGSLSNNTNTYLPIDILDKYAKKQLLIETLIELEVLILDITEINLNTKNLQQLNNKIIYDVVNKVISNFVNKLKHQEKRYHLNYYNNYNQLFFNEHKILIHSLLIYLIFGSNSIDKHRFPFYNLKTPFNHVKILFENTIMQISNIIAFNLLENCSSMKNVYEFLTINNICNPTYKSIRLLSNFRNNLINYNWINKYIYYPQNIYCSNYQILLLSSNGIIYRNIYINRISDYLKLSKIQLISILYLEIQDFIIPKINNLIILLGKLIIYILGELISKSIKICSTAVIQKINENKR
uniref:Conserved hypothetical plastid protein n=1 Tax=Calliarthron tuberculosum TaxID=48942 RepID=M4IU30_CALTB|nr:conserved hypothetical plastid protein [Calliarthron tuberculosum]AGA63758.1 conserved hypothetical plastid protein [Calliarthron tuberculosum]